MNEKNVNDLLFSYVKGDLSEEESRHVEERCAVDAEEYYGKGKKHRRMTMTRQRAYGKNQTRSACTMPKLHYGWPWGIKNNPTWTNLEQTTLRRRLHKRTTG